MEKQVRFWGEEDEVYKEELQQELISKFTADYLTDFIDAMHVRQQPIQLTSWEFRVRLVSGYKKDVIMFQMSMSIGILYVLLSEPTTSACQYTDMWT